MTVEQALTLTGFLEGTGARLRFYDMGRRITPIGRDSFLRFEHSAQPYPYPLRGQAWFALVQTRAATEPLIWFLHFELDEQGGLVLASRDHFLHGFGQIAADRAQDPGIEQALQDSPYTFRPGDEKMANFHAMLARDLGAPPSSHFAHALAYFGGELGWEQWKFLGLQGIADIAARLDQPGVTQRLLRACPQLPDEPLIALCHCLEHHPLNRPLATAVAARLDSALDEGAPAAPNRVAALLRALAQGPDEILHPTLGRVLSHPVSTDPEVLAAIAGRLWEALLDPPLARAYLERLACEQVAPAVFRQCLGELLRIPGLGRPLLQVVRDPARSDALGQAFQAMLEG